MNAHTPGPWEACHELDSSDESYVVRASMVEVCRIGDYCEQPRDAHNARLIAAAPDLLRLLREMVSLCACGDVDETTEALGWGSVIRDANAVIAKATGDAS